MTDLATRLAYDLTRTAVVTQTTLPAATVAAARLFAQPADGTVLVTAGRSSANDGGGGSWVWDSSSTDDDDGSLTLAISGVTTGRWRRQYTGPVDVRWFGAVGDGVTDDAAAFQSALDSLESGGVLFVPSGIYKLGTQVTVTHDNVEIRGDGRGTQINKVFADGAAIRFLGVTSWRLRDLYVQCLLDTTGSGVGVDIDGSSHGLCEGVRVYNTRSHGIRVGMTESGSGAYYNELRGCHVFNATGAAIYCGTQANQTKISGGDYTSSTYGLWAEDCESINCSGASFEGNATAGARVGTFGVASAGVNFTDCRFESAGVTQYGVWVDHASSYVALKGGFPGGELAEIHNPRSSPYLEVGGFNPPSTTPAEGRYAYGLQTARGARFAGMTWTNDGAGTTTGAYAATLKVQTTGSNPLQLQSASGYVEMLSGGLNFVGGAGRVCANLAASALYLQGSGSGGVVVEGTGTFQTTSDTPMQAGGTFRVVGNVGFYGASPQAKPTVSGSHGSNAALQSLLTALSTLGLITNNSSA